jgi:hypothetical protein
MVSMKGGIQPGTTASSPESLELDLGIKQVAEYISSSKEVKLKYDVDFHNRGQNRILKELDNEWPYGCVPDGLMWFEKVPTTPEDGYFKRKLKVVFEGKRQQMKGNAEERWFKNFITCRYINSDMQYVTFCSGEGVKKNGPLYNLEKATRRVFPGNVHFYMKQDGFTQQEIFHIMTEHLGLSNLQYSEKLIKDEKKEAA